MNTWKLPPTGRFHMWQKLNFASQLVLVLGEYQRINKVCDLRIRLVFVSRRKGPDKTVFLIICRSIIDGWKHWLWTDGVSWWQEVQVCFDASFLSAPLEAGPGVWDWLSTFQRSCLHFTSSPDQTEAPFVWRAVSVWCHSPVSHVNSHRFAVSHREGAIDRLVNIYKDVVHKTGVSVATNLCRSVMCFCFFLSRRLFCP